MATDFARLNKQPNLVNENPDGHQWSLQLPALGRPWIRSPQTAKRNHTPHTRLRRCEANTRRRPNGAIDMQAAPLLAS